ncbi:MAG: AraC family transcriptional regulator [Bacteroidota bacterium]
MAQLKTDLEQIPIPNGSSLRLMVNPDLSDFFFWHFHPEFELVYLTGADGTRHVGDHISRFQGSDLVLIGSNIPHLNFDYGIKAPYEKYVVHLRPDFLQFDRPANPELEQIRQLIDRSASCIAFSSTVQEVVGPLIHALPSQSSFDQFLSVLRILYILSNDDGMSLLHEAPFQNQYTQRDQNRLKAVYAYIDAHYMHKIDNHEVAGLTNLTFEAFCRFFKKMTKLTFTEFVNQYRIDASKRMLMMGHTVSEACYSCGFESLSYFNRTFKKLTGENPTAFKRRFS